MKRAFFLRSFATALLLTPVLVSAQPPEGQPNRPNQRRQGPGQPGEMGPQNGGPMKTRRDLKAELGLTEVQQADIRKALESAQRDRLRKSTDLKIANLDLRSLLRAEKVDEKAVAARLAEAQAAQGALLKLRIDTALAMKRVLTPEQQKKFAEIKGEQGRPRMGQRMKMRGMRNRGMGQGMTPGMRDDDSDLDLDFDLDEESGAMIHGDLR